MRCFGKLGCFKIFTPFIVGDKSGCQILAFADFASDLKRVCAHGDFKFQTSHLGAP
jgi:hypothetical protein